jgi:hypothetical protein
MLVCQCTDKQDAIAIAAAMNESADKDAEIARLERIAAAARDMALEAESYVGIGFDHEESKELTAAIAAYRKATEDHE